MKNIIKFPPTKEQEARREAAVAYFMSAMPGASKEQVEEMLARPIRRRITTGMRIVLFKDGILRGVEEHNYETWLQSSWKDGTCDDWLSSKVTDSNQVRLFRATWPYGDEMPASIREKNLWLTVEPHGVNNKDGKAVLFTLVVRDALGRENAEIFSHDLGEAQLAHDRIAAPDLFATHE